MRGAQWRIGLDRQVCAGAGLCLGTAPGLIRLDAGRGRPVHDLIAPDDAMADAAEICPMQAITVRDAVTGDVLAPVSGVGLS